MQTDFNQLYSRLGLEPGCSLREFKQAYRRQFSELHPDRQGAQALPPDAQDQLREVIALYGSALNFYRRYGRLPGAPLPAPEPRTAAGGPMASEPTAFPGTRARRAMVAIRPAADDAGQSVRRRRIATVLMATCVVVLIATWNSSPPTAPETLPEPLTPTTGPVAREGSMHDEAPQIKLGLDKSDVRSIQGEPLRVRDDVWQYGPSWMRFEHGRLVDWYSSPMNRLKTPATRPARPPELSSASQ